MKTKCTSCDTVLEMQYMNNNMQCMDCAYKNHTQQPEQLPPHVVLGRRIDAIAALLNIEGWQIDDKVEELYPRKDSK